MKLLTRLLGPIIFLSFVYFYVDLNQLKEIGSMAICHFFLLSIALVPLLVFVKSIRWQKILAKYDISYTRWHCFRIYFVEMVTIMAVATIGTFVKAVYPKRDGHGLLRPILSIIGDKYFDYLLPLVFGVTSAVLIVLKLKADLSLIILFLVTCLMFVPARKSISVFPPRIIPTRVKELFSEKGWNLAEHFTKIEEVLDYNTYALSVAGFGLFYLAVYFLAKGLGIDLSFAQIVLVMTVTSLITLIPISFFGVGTRDAGLLAAFKWFHHTPEEAIALSMALLLLRVAIVLIGSIFWFTDPPPLRELKGIK
jgi:uncharacterized membrane protein YbhN (UPF0104 family)